MESSSSEQQNTKAVEAKVGGLVWVRRRNGAWWPGQILGLHQVLADCIASPKSGTPIKLLGRDDPIVDWYDLEKSTRVKAFCCGECDECIEKAKASMVGYARKAVKYARKAHAILHALELESAIIPRDNENCSASDDADSKLCSRRGEVFPAVYGHSKDSKCMSEQICSFEDNSNSAIELSTSGISYEESDGTRYIKRLPTKATMRKIVPNKSEDEVSDGIRRMHGLEDWGLIECRRLVESIGLIDVSQGNGLVTDSSPMPLGSMSNGTKDTMPTLKRKRSQLLQNHDSLKKKHRRRTIMKVLGTLVTVPIIFDEFSDAPVLGLKSKESKRSYAQATNCAIITGVAAQNKDVYQLDDDGVVGDLFDVPIQIEELHAGCASSSLECQDQTFGCIDQNRILENVTQGDGAVNEVFSTSPSAAQTNHISAQNLDESTAKWQIKGRRKLRLSNRSGCSNVGPSDLSPLPNGGNHVGPFAPRSSLRLRDISLNGDGCLDRSKGILSTIPHDVSHSSPHNGFELPQRNVHEGTVLYDVSIEVKASCRPQHVPYISLRSKLNGKAVTGYPVTVEIMDDSGCEVDHDYLLYSSDCNPSSSGCEVDHDEDAGMDYVIKLKGAKHPKPLSQPLSRKKSSKLKKHGSSSKKTRMLSALSIPHRSVRDKERSLFQNFKGPTLACIPLKLVFSRINEALNGSGRWCHHSLRS